MADLAGRVVVVTGGNGGIGLGLARGAARHGASICVLARNELKNRRAVAELRAIGVDAEAFECDVSNEESIQEAVTSCVARFGRIDAMFANAGITSLRQRFVDSTVEEWNRVLQTNLVGVVLTLREAAKVMVERGEGGSLVAVSSVSAIDGAPGVLPYATSKTALLGLMRGLAVEMARFKIRANTVIPGWVETEMTDPLKENERFMSTTTARTPARRWGMPSDFEEAGAFLADPTQYFHTGDTIVIDGGYSIF